MTDLFPSSPFFANMARSTEEDDDDPSALWQWVYVVLPRVQGVIYLTGAIPTLVMAWKRREFVFHRLALAMAGYAFLAGVFNLVGSLAIPADASGIKGNYGTQLTCTVQGFFLYVSTRTMFFYYSGLSFYSYVGILCGFQKASYKWCEKWIHIAAHIYTVSVGVYLLVVDGYNPREGYCGKSSYPMGCEFNDEISCDRGPPKAGIAHQFLVEYVVVFTVILFPTVVMAALYVKVQKQEQQAQGPVCVVKAKDIAKQSLVYLVPLYWLAPSFFIYRVLESSGNLEGENLRWLKLALILISSMFAVLAALAYRYFTMGPPEGKPERKGAVIFENDCCGLETETPVVSTIEPEPEAATPSYSFNIFDGTNASGAFAEFVHEGDSDDERQDRAETERWESVQNHV
mmetsp:Transcript_2628/g.5658  ORF Transcript_2628/g.5658 Transcript_2628/m.5658 type:complete len:401 (+) Transcript_2628:150-1352(+)